MSTRAQEDHERCLQEAEEERAEQRAKLFLPVGDKVDGFVIAEDGDDAPKLVEEIESLCMSCQENVSTADMPKMYHGPDISSRGLLECFSPRSPIFAKLS